jgi:UDP-N-acetylglucosamine:LPS N-acetylglucosamine transferase
VPDATRSNKLSILLSALAILLLLVRVRPNLVISTGSLPGFLVVRLGHLFGVRTVWVDSIANVEVLSVSGQRIGPHADLWLTQWEHLARPGGPGFRGAVL